MTTCRDQHKTVPNRVVKAQAPQNMKERAKRIEDAPDRETTTARISLSTVASGQWVVSTRSGEVPTTCAGSGRCTGCGWQAV